MAPTARLPDDLAVLVRGWLHGNVVACRGARPGLVDTGYHSGLDAVCAWAHGHLGPAAAGPLTVLLTHVHADHAGGVAGLRARGPVEVWAHSAAAANIAAWDERALWLGPTEQVLPRFTVDRVLVPGAVVAVGDRRWEVIETGGHATGGVSFFDAADGVLVTGDALWEDGFGLLIPWMDGAHVLDDAAAALDRLARVPARVVVPGHGAPFSDLAGAVTRARSRLAHLRRHPERLRAQVVKNGLGFWVLDHPQATAGQIVQYATRLARLHGVDVAAAEQLVGDLARTGSG